MAHSTPTTGATPIDILQIFADILELAAAEPKSLPEAFATLRSLEERRAHTPPRP